MIVFEKFPCILFLKLSFDDDLFFYLNIIMTFSLSPRFSLSFCNKLKNLVVHSLKETHS